MFLMLLDFTRFDKVVQIVLGGLSWSHFCELDGTSSYGFYGWFRMLLD